MDWATLFDAALVASVVRALIPVLLAALGGLISERAGVFNIALEGMMLSGCFGAVAVSYATGNGYLGALGGAASGVAVAAVLAYAAIDRRADAIVIGIAINLLAAGVTTYLLSSIFDVRGTFQSPRIAALPALPIPFLSELPWVGNAVFDLTILGYVALIGVPVVAFTLRRTPLGLRVRGVGERPVSAATLGVSPSRIRWGAVLVSGALCGLGGAQLALSNVVLFAEGMTSGRGWIAVVAVMLGRAAPWPVLGACVLFALAEALGFRLQGNGLPVQITDAAPYVVTLLALLIVSVRTRTRLRRSRAFRRRGRRPDDHDLTRRVPAISTE